MPGTAIAVDRFCVCPILIAVFSALPGVRLGYRPGVRVPQAVALQLRVPQAVALQTVFYLYLAPAMPAGD